MELLTTELLYKGSPFLKCVASLWINFSGTGKIVKIWHFFILFWSSFATKQFDFCQLFSTVLKRFCHRDSKNVFVLVLAYLGLFEVDDIGDDGVDDL